MKLAYKNMECILDFSEGCVNELVIENKKMFFEVINSMMMQIDGLHGNCILSIADKPMEFSKYADLTVQFAPFELNRKSILTKLHSALEKNAQTSENYAKTAELLGELERYMLHLSEELPFEINCQRLAIGSVIKALSPEIDESDKKPLEKIFTYMELVRELDRDKLFIMVNMRSYFTDEDMEIFTESICLHDFKVLLLEAFAFPKLKHSNRFVVDNDLCEF